MNFAICFLISMIPLTSMITLISCDNLVNLGIEKVVQKSSNQVVQMNTKDSISDLKKSQGDFESTIKNCIVKVGFDDAEYLNCYYELSNKTGILHPNDTLFVNKTSCCNRMVKFQCWKQLLTSRCEVPKDQVEKNDDVHFKYWNNLDDEETPEKCKFDKERSLEYCRLNSGASVTWNIALLLAGIFVWQILSYNL